MICSNCGADIGDNETACPYCGAMQYENSEQKYMKDLYNLNEGMESLDKNARKYIIKSTLKSAGIVCAAIAAAVLPEVCLDMAHIQACMILHETEKRYTSH